MFVVIAHVRLITRILPKVEKARQDKIYEEQRRSEEEKKKAEDERLATEERARKLAVLRCALSFL